LFISDNSRFQVSQELVVVIHCDKLIIIGKPRLSENALFVPMFSYPEPTDLDHDLDLPTLNLQNLTCLPLTHHRTYLVIRGAPIIGNYRPVCR